MKEKFKKFLWLFATILFIIFLIVSISTTQKKNERTLVVEIAPQYQEETDSSYINPVFRGWVTDQETYGELEMRAYTDRRNAQALYYIRLNMNILGHSAFCKLDQSRELIVNGKIIYFTPESGVCEYAQKRYGLYPSAMICFGDEAHCPNGSSYIEDQYGNRYTNSIKLLVKE